MIEIVVALVVLVVISGYITYVFGFFDFIPGSIMAIVLLALAIDIVLFIIHRKGN